MDKYYCTGNARPDNRSSKSPIILLTQSITDSLLFFHRLFAVKAENIPDKKNTVRCIGVSKLSPRFKSTVYGEKIIRPFFRGTLISY